MAMTLRTDKRFDELIKECKDRFQETTSSKAIFRALSFVINQVPQITAKNEEIREENRVMYKQYDELFYAIRQKEQAEATIRKILQEDEQAKKALMLLNEED